VRVKKKNKGSLGIGLRLRAKGSEGVSAFWMKRGFEQLLAFVL